MIKVIASDMDGTLLNREHQVEEETFEAIKRAQDAGVRFILVTGRNYPEALRQLEGKPLGCDYILGSGAEIRNAAGQPLLQTPLDAALCGRLLDELADVPVSICLFDETHDYRIGTEEEVMESLLEQLKLFHMTADDQEILQSELYHQILSEMIRIETVRDVKPTELRVFKLVVFSTDQEMLAHVREKLEPYREIAISSSFPTNLEITNVLAQKGPVLKSYIEQLGYSMGEVMAIGDSMNDYSMLSMDFGMTVAMENAVPEIKAVSKYHTKSNQDGGVAYAIEMMMNEGMERLRKE